MRSRGLRISSNRRVARRVVPAKDTPGFIANRFGMWALLQAIHTIEKLHLSVEQGDLFIGQLIGLPRSGTFALADMIGIDVMMDIARGLNERCPERRTSGRPKVSVLNSIALDPRVAGRQNRSRLLPASSQGDHGARSRDARVSNGPAAGIESAGVAEMCRLPLGGASGSKALDSKDEAGEFVRTHLLPTLRYANEIKEVVSYSVRDFDRVMRWGWGWEMGPFELIDAIGADRVGIPAKQFYQGGSFLGFDGHMVPAECGT